MQAQREAAPFSIEAEMAVIGGMLLDGDAVMRAMDLLEAGDFYREANRVLFETIARLADEGRGVDSVTLTDELARRETLHKAGGVEYLSDLYDYVTTAANIEYHAAIVREKAQLRRLARIGADLGEMVKAGKTASEVQERAESLIFQAGERSVQDAPMTPIKGVIMEAHKKLERNEPDIRTGFLDLDRLTGGFPKGDLIILAARPSMGKTAAGLQWAVNIADKERRPVAVFSLEMSKQALGLRMLFTEARVDGTKFTTDDPDACARLLQATNFLSALPMLVHDRAKTVREIRSHCRRIALEQGAMGAVVIDYLGKLRGTRGTENRIHELGEITGDLKALAVELDCPVVVLCQLSRAVEARQDKRPMLSDLRDSGEIEQDADTVVMLYRPEYYFGPSKDGTSLVGLAEVIVAKQRNGATGTVPMHFHAPFTRFEDIAHWSER